MGRRTKRSIPLILIIIVIGQFWVIENVGEPFPALLLPPFPANSPIDSIQLTKYEYRAIAQDHDVQEVNLDEIFPMAPKLTAFYMALALTRNQGYDRIEQRKREFNKKPEWKQFLLRRRENVLINAWSQYDEAREDIANSLDKHTGKKITSLAIVKSRYVVDGRRMEVDTVHQNIESIPLNTPKNQEE